MNLQNILLVTGKANTAQRETPLLQQLSYFIICGGLGILGGAIGVALAILFAISLTVVGRVPGDSILLGQVPLALVAVLAGLGGTWLLHRGMHAIFWTNLNATLRKHGLQLMLVLSALTALLQTFIFMAGF